MRYWLCQAVPLLVLVACSETTFVGAPDAGATDIGLDGESPDAGGGGSDGGGRDLGEPLVCGDAVCAVGADSCCPWLDCLTGETEALCPLEGNVCPDQAPCPGQGPCDPLRVRGEGGCEAELGVTWNGETCEFISGCECVGLDCAQLYPDLGTCFTAHAECLPGCTREEGACNPSLFCDFTPNTCGADGEEGTCAPRPDGCLDIWQPVCGCDGETYGNGCEANVAGQDVAYLGEC